MNIQRFRERRVNEAVREVWREHRLQASDFVLPLFLLEGSNRAEEIPSMPGVSRFSADRAVEYLRPLIESGLSSVLLFGIPDRKGVDGAKSPLGVVQKAIPLFREACPSLQIITDVCICSYTEDGHCHIGDNDATCTLLAEIALSHAVAGAHVVAPSDMMDGRVYAIRSLLDSQGYATPILSYAAKYASALYGPFRHAAECTPQEGDRRGYQMDCANGDEALLEVAADFVEGAESVIVKPALLYLDVVRRVHERWPTRKVFAYNVSGEYTMLQNAVAQGVLAPAALDEALLSFKRAGATAIITYDAPRWLLGQNRKEF